MYAWLGVCHRPPSTFLRCVHNPTFKIPSQLPIPTNRKHWASANSGHAEQQDKKHSYFLNGASFACTAITNACLAIVAMTRAVTCHDNGLRTIDRHGWLKDMDSIYSLRP
jgi:hypothetical protein